MGIQGLLPLLKSIHKPTHLRTFSGQTLGVDAYGWLHRGTVACAIELAEGKPTRKHIDFALHRVRMLIHFGVKPYMVFDGDYLPSKSHTEKERAARRKESKRLGLELLRMGRTSQAQLELQKAIDVTPTMARELIEELKRLDVPYVVAPYEADSQLAYLEKRGIINGVVSEDSDLLVFGVNCLITKLDQYGECIMINRADFTACRDISLVGWSDKEFRMMAMLSGCDYLPGIDKMGLKTAYRLVRKHKTIERIIRTIQFDGKMKVPAGYLEAFQTAERTFMHQWVFCPEARELLNLNALPTSVEVSSMPYIGKHVEPELATGVAYGDLDPNTKQPIVLPNRFDSRARHHQITQTPDEKQGKPITEFFKKRTPLAELDPNSFTPIDSQRQLLERHRNASWSASQVPTASILGRRRTSSIPVPSSAPQASRRVATHSFLSARASSPKRQRLCSDSIVPATMSGTDDLHNATSKFFAETAAPETPLMRRKPGRSKSDEFELWSDDSAAEAVAAATAAPIGTPTTNISSLKKRKKMEVFADTPTSDVDSSVSGISQDSILTVATELSEDAAGAMTPDTSFESISPTQEHSSINHGIKSNLAALRWHKSPMSRASPQRTKSAPLFASTPLQFAKCAEPPVEKTAHPITPSLKDEMEVPSSCPPGADDSPQTEQLITPDQRPKSNAWSRGTKGSEDLLVPESPEASDVGGVASRLNLGKFTFTG